MTRRLALALALLLLVIAAGTTPWPAPRAALNALGDAAANGGGRLRLSVADGSTITLLPEPRLEASTVRIEDHDGEPALRVDRLSASVRILPLLAGHFALADVTLVRPRLRVQASPSDAAHAAASPFRLDGGLGLAALDRLIVIEGDVTGDAVSADAVNLVVRRRGGGLDVAGTLQVSGQPIEVQLSGPRPEALASGAETPLTAALRTGHGTLQFTGTVANAAPLWQATGALTAAVQHAPALSRWLGAAWPLPLGEAATVSAAVRLNGSTLALTDARIQTPAGALDGVLAARLTSGHIGLSGTLAAERLDLSAALHPLLPPRHADGSWNSEPIPLSSLPNGDTDLRLSAGQLVLGKVTLDNAALSLLSRPGRADLTLSSGELLGGRIKGRATVAYGEADGLDFKAQGSFDRIDAARALLQFAGSERLTGTAAGSFSVEGSGPSFAAIVRSLDGKASATVRQGELLGINLPEVLRRIERRPLIAALDMRGGKTPFDVAAFGGRIGKGVLDLTDGALSSPATKVTLAGQIGLADRVLQLTGQVQAADPSREPAVLPFAVSGSFDEPSIVPDARSILRKSGALTPAPASADGALSAVAVGVDLPAP